jgi:hypothetical protein
MSEDLGVDELLRQWTSERSHDTELTEARDLAFAWLAESDAPPPGIPGQRSGSEPSRHAGAGGGLFAVEVADQQYVVAMRDRLPGVPEEALEAAARCWQLVGGLAEAKEWWDAGVSPLDQRALEYRAAGLAPSDLARHLGPYTVLEHLRRGSAPAWCVARLQRQRSDTAA